MKTALVFALLFGWLATNASAQTGNLPVEEISPTTHCKEKTNGKPRLKSVTTGNSDSRDNNSDLKLRTEEAGSQENRSGGVPDSLMSDTAGVDTSSLAANLPDC